MAFKYESKAKEVKYVMTELERAGLKEIAKILRKKVKAAVPVDQGVLKKNVGTWVKRKDGSLQIGVYTRDRARRKKYIYAYHAHLVEFGTKKMAARSFLKSTIMANLNDIIAVQAKYLKAIEDENRAKGLINPEEEISDD
ncbi:MAG: HK97 gp10 family phage protein [Bacteroidales bacterium]|nr:HK97 gp10 family phage protein [Bacteroidales bacterium]